MCRCYYSNIGTSAIENRYGYTTTIESTEVFRFVCNLEVVTFVGLQLKVFDRPTVYIRKPVQSIAAHPLFIIIHVTQSVIIWGWGLVMATFSIGI